MLKLTIEWEPDSPLFPFLDEEGDVVIDEDCNCPYENYTVGGLVSRNYLQFGYIEIRAKAAPLPISSEFWMIGNRFEIDIFEMIGQAGDGPDGSGVGVKTLMPVTINNWDAGGLEDNGYGEEYELGWDVSEDVHVYGAKWTTDAILFFADGEERGRITRDEVGLLRNTDNLHVWVDNEVFSWEGFSSPEALPKAYEID